ncbi:unnamed protein product, partial [Mesorhabditis belari]|uniref:Major facilitator superfamily (MFS) profile domain-containing protein n=1 Tax=Mesorhabditis belari TaxID=2138241 RepID=A0AAF3EHD1_9BILA
MVTSIRLLLLAIVISFCSNWQFAFQITYVNTSVKTFYDLANQGYQLQNRCSKLDPHCRLPNIEWSERWSTIVSSFYPGTLVGFLAVPFIVERIGVKSTMITMSFSAIAGCLVHFFAAFSVHSESMNKFALSLPRGYGAFMFDAILVLGRFLIGCQSGTSLSLLPLYIVEVSPLKDRGFLNTFQQVAQAVGTLLGLLIGSEAIIPLGEWRYTVMQVAALLPTLLYVAVLTLTPKTPMQLLKDGSDISQVLSSLRFYHGKEGNLKEVENETAQATKMSYDQKPEGIPWATWKGFFIGACAAMSYSFTADDLIDTFSAQILHKAPMTNGTEDGDLIDDSADRISVILGGILVVGSIAGTFLIDRFGRRPLLLLGLLGSAISNAVAVIFCTNSLIVTLGFAATKLFIGLGAGAPAWFLTSELVHPHYMTVMQSLSTGLLLMSTALATFFFLRLELWIGTWSMFALSSAPALVLAIILFLYLPETKDRNHEEIQRILGKTSFSGLIKKGGPKIAPYYVSIQSVIANMEASDWPRQRKSRLTEEENHSQSIRAPTDYEKIKRPVERDWPICLFLSLAGALIVAGLFFATITGFITYEGDAHRSMFEKQKSMYEQGKHVEIPLQATPGQQRMEEEKVWTTAVPEPVPTQKPVVSPRTQQTPPPPKPPQQAAQQSAKATQQQPKNAQVSSSTPSQSTQQIPQPAHQTQQPPLNQNQQKPSPQPTVPRPNPQQNAQPQQQKLQQPVAQGQKTPPQPAGKTVSVQQPHPKPKPAQPSQAQQQKQTAQAPVPQSASNQPPPQRSTPVPQTPENKAKPNTPGSQP